MYFGSVAIPNSMIHSIHKTFEDIPRECLSAKYSWKCNLHGGCQVLWLYFCDMHSFGLWRSTESASSVWHMTRLGIVMKKTAVAEIAQRLSVIYIKTPSEHLWDAWNERCPCRRISCRNGNRKRRDNPAIYFNCFFQGLLGTAFIRWQKFIPTFNCQGTTE